MLGITMYVTRGFSQQAPPPLNKFGIGKFLGVPLTLYVVIVIAAIAIIVALPISVATSLMINEIAPPRLRGWLIALIDLLATVPSIVYGFWGLE